MSIKENFLEHHPILREVGGDDERKFPRLEKRWAAGGSIESEGCIKRSLICCQERLRPSAEKSYGYYEIVRSAAARRIGSLVADRARFSKS